MFSNIIFIPSRVFKSISCLFSPLNSLLALLKSFKDISFKLGSNSHLVQAAGGNTSIKSDGRMLIKASGTWLINSLDKDIFVEVDLNSITEKINNGK